MFGLEKNGSSFVLRQLLSAVSCCDASSRSKQDPLPEGGREYRQRYTWDGSARSASLCIYIASRVCVAVHWNTC